MTPPSAPCALRLVASALLTWQNCKTLLPLQLQSILIKHENPDCPVDHKALEVGCSLGLVGGVYVIPHVPASLPEQQQQQQQFYFFYLNASTLNNTDTVRPESNCSCRNQTVLGKVRPGGLLHISKMEVLSLVVFSNHSAFHRWSVQSATV